MNCYVGREPMVPLRPLLSVIYWGDIARTKDMYGQKDIAERYGRKDIAEKYVWTKRYC
jgi:hypothetical protein